MRSKREYDESHVITARRVKKVPQQSQSPGRLAALREWGENEDFTLDQEVAPAVGHWAQRQDHPCASPLMSPTLPKVSQDPHHGQQLH